MASALQRLARAIPSLTRAGAALDQPEVAGRAVAAAAAKLAGPGRGHATSAVTPADIGHATGLEREELEARAKGVDPFHEAWLDAPWGTEAAPVAVPSEFAERIVGVPDADDDSLVWWGTLEDGAPPKQIVEGGEFFVLKRVPSSGGHH